MTSVSGINNNQRHHCAIVALLAGAKLFELKRLSVAAHFKIRHQGNIIQNSFSSDTYYKSGISKFYNHRVKGYSVDKGEQAIKMRRLALS